MLLYMKSSCGASQKFSKLVKILKKKFRNSYVIDVMEIYCQYVGEQTKKTFMQRRRRKVQKKHQIWIINAFQPPPLKI